MVNRRRGYHQQKHTRTSKRGRRFKAGQSKFEYVIAPSDFWYKEIMRYKKSLVKNPYIIVRFNNKTGMASPMKSGRTKKELKKYLRSRGLKLTRT